MLQIRSRCAIAYSQPLDPPQYNRRANITKPTYSGTITTHAAKRIKQACEILLMRSPERWVFNTVTRRYIRLRLTFATLTISCPQIIPHREAYERGLKPMLRWWRDKAGCKDYIWKAELQQRGQIHWHITGNQFVDWRHLKSAWNNIQFKNGWLDDYHAKTGLWTPNSTDIHAVEKVERLDLYLAKYISKTGGQIQGKCWDTSNTLAGKKYFKMELDNDVAALMDRAIYRREFIRKQLEHCSIFEGKHPEKLIPGSQQSAWQSWLK